jgi:hypothetical protein
MIHALLAASHVRATFDRQACVATVRLARIHLVDGMPFVGALRPTIRIRFHPDPSSGTKYGFTIADGTKPVAYLRYAPDGMWEVKGDVRRDPAGRFVDVMQQPGNCVRDDAMSATLAPS